MGVRIAACSAKTKPPEPAVSRPPRLTEAEMRQVEQSGPLLLERSMQLPLTCLPDPQALGAGGEVIPLAIQICWVQPLPSKILL